MFAKLIMGSRLYGTSDQKSDYDIKSIQIPCANDILLGRVNTIYKPVGCVDPETNIDEEIIDLIHFFSRLRKANTSEIESLFCTAENTLISNPIWEEIKKDRLKFITRDLNNILGFTISKANDIYINPRTVQRILDYFEKEKEISRESRPRLGTERILRAVAIANNEKVSIIEIENKEDVPMLHLMIFGRAISKNTKLIDACKILKLIIKAGLENKLSRSHYNALRISEEIIELLKNGEIIFPRENASQLIDIKNGNYAVSRIKEMIYERIENIKNLQRYSELPEVFPDALAEEYICKAHREKIVTVKRGKN